MHQKEKKIRGRGRPVGATQDIPLQMRVNAQFLKEIDDWRRKQEDLPPRTEAIRRLVREGIKATR